MSKYSPIRYSANIIADSVGPTGVRLVTAVLVFPRSILAEHNTHRMLSRNAASSRAVPAHKMMASISETPFVPIWMENKAGMQSVTELEDEAAMKADSLALTHMRSALNLVTTLTDKEGLNIHKQYANRYLEPFMWTEVIMSATDLENYFAQRTDSAAEPGFQRVTKLLRAEMSRSTPRALDYGEWHMPYLDQEIQATTTQLAALTYIEMLDYLKAYDTKSGTNYAGRYSEDRFRQFATQDVSAGRCAAVSYLNHDTGRVDVMADIRRSVSLSMSYPGHWSPMEHAATPARPGDMVYRLDQLQLDLGRLPAPAIVPKDGELGYCGNFREFKQYRKFYPYTENIMDMNS